MSGAISNWMNTPGNAGEPATIYDVAELVARAYPLTFTRSNIASRFRVTGFLLMTENIFPNSEFLTSSVTDMPMVENQDVASTLTNSIFSGPSGSASCASLSKFINNQVINIVSPEEIRHYPKAKLRK